MSRYEQIKIVKMEISELRSRLANLKGKEPSYENGKRVAEIENEIAKLQSFVKAKSVQYGFVA